MNRIITIGREFGSGGREIGHKIAEKLHIAYYDRAIVNELMKRTELAEDYLKKMEETGPFPLMTFTTGRSLWSSMNPMLEQHIDVLSEESEVIMEMAKKSDCVIVGRRADYVLREMNPLRVFTYADMDYKLARCRAREKAEEKMTDKKLRQEINRMDKNRSEYYAFLTGNKWGDRNNYDLCVNTGTNSIDKIVDGIIAFL
jgi:cytidylate kinase